MTLDVLGYIRTPFCEKFGVPRQSGLAESVQGEIELYPEFDRTGVYDGLGACTHLWLTFWFHAQEQAWTSKVRPPRLGGNKKLGVFATRTPRRPNPIGLSVVKILLVDTVANRLVVSGVDLLDKTPILDIKPYLPYADCIPEASTSFARHAPARLTVEIAQDLEGQFADKVGLLSIIRDVLSFDSRPAYHEDGKIYGTALAGYNVRWLIEDKCVRVFELEALDA